MIFLLLYITILTTKKGGLMNYQQEYDLLTSMIDQTQKQIAKDPKDKIYLIDELEQLQNELKELQDRTRRKRMNDRNVSRANGERRTI
jgi:hypothetical protein